MTFVCSQVKQSLQHGGLLAHQQRHQPEAAAAYPLIQPYQQLSWKQFTAR
jgi:hypothetical protein